MHLRIKYLFPQFKRDIEKMLPIGVGADSGGEQQESGRYFEHGV